MAYSVVKSGGRQYIVSEGEVLKVNRIPGVSEGDKYEFNEVLFVSGGDSGTKFSDDKCKVIAEVLENRRDKKILMLKKRRRKSSQRKKGHRQDITVLRVLEIVV